MRTSSQKTTAAVLRQKSGTKDISIKDVEWAKMLGRSVQAIHNIESGRTKLRHELATKMYEETGISIDWLMKGDPTVPPISESGEPYTREIYERVQAQKTPYNQPHPMYRHYDKLGFCARLIAILESASARKDYYMARYKVHTALDSLRREFGMDEEVYQHSGPNDVNNIMAIAALKEVLARDEEIESFFEQLHHPTPKPKKKQSSKKRR
jgi:hypothetical protein